uniref:DIS3-like exonuclease 2 n=1 Tax=Ananas comosus var. bracteatus TaxID=296719 RepID=A0A6V7P7Y0_ANACO|nr:unnamed protein product [Ananas comosus var. bracteatus]
MKSMVEPAAAAAAAEEADKEKKRRRRQNRRTKQGFAGVQGGACSSSVDLSCGGQSSTVPMVAFNSLPSMRISEAANSKVAARKHFAPHWPDQAVDEALKKGNAFEAKFRVNPHNRVEAYCTIDGLPVDILISGANAQNRAIEGDVVAIMLDPVAYWTKMKGQNIPCNTSSTENSSNLPEVQEVMDNRFARKEQSNASCARPNCSDGLLQLERGHCFHKNGSFSEAVQCECRDDPHTTTDNEKGHPVINGNSHEIEPLEQGETARALERIRAMINSHPCKRPTGKVLSIIKMSPRREAVIGFLTYKPQFPNVECHGKHFSGQSSKRNEKARTHIDCMYLIPTDPKFPRMVVTVSSLPDSVKERLKNCDQTVEKELIAARVDEWSDENLLPEAHIMHVLGKGGEIETQIGAILFENAINAADFSPESMACIPDASWKVPMKELETRKDLRNVLTFTIDPSSAIDLDDALSVETISDGKIRVGVHIADVSYFVRPDTALDTEAQIRSTSVYILQHRLPMLPPELSGVSSLSPGLDRLAFSIMWDIDRHGNIIDRWIGQSVISSCCKLSYELVEDVINANFDQSSPPGSSCPQLHGQFEWKDVVNALGGLHMISKTLKEMRFKDGALWLNNTKLVFMFDECGTPYDSYQDERKRESYSLVEEFMLLANRSAAEIISKAFPDCALLRRHPEPNLRKLKEFEAFCSRHGFKLDTSSSGQLHLSLSRIREKLKDDPVLFDILVSYASKPMQSATYFCTGDLRGKEDDWAHYALSMPFYTHFTSPLRRYPDIIVHRTLYAALDAEELYVKQNKDFLRANKGEVANCDATGRFFTGLHFNKDAADSKEGREALSAAALKFRVPGSEVLGEVAAHCNERKLASRHAEEAGEKLYLWALLKKKEILVCEARVLGLGPRFMSIYIHKLAIERRIYYDEVEGLAVEWLETTNTLVVDVVRNKPFQKKGKPQNYQTIEDVAMVLNPSDSISSEKGKELLVTETEPAVFPLVLRHLSAVPVALHAIGGDDGPLDIGARLYMSSYFK